MNSVASKLTGLLEGILGPATSLEGNPLTAGYTSFLVTPHCLEVPGLAISSNCRTRLTYGKLQCRLAGMY